VTDYTAVATVNPLTGEAMTIFNLLPGKLGLVDTVDRNSPINRRFYNSFDAGVNVRLPNGGTMLGGWTTERIVAITCDTRDPNQFRFCDQTGETYQDLGANESIPFAHQFKLAVTYPLPFRTQVSLSVLSFRENRWA
jgi:hypothetical protein